MITKDQWEYIFLKDKYKDHLPINVMQRPLPKWSNDFSQNVTETLDWMARRFKTDVDWKFGEKPLVKPLKEGWYLQEHHDGMYHHVCDQKALLKYRQQYESAYEPYNTQSLNLKQASSVHNSVRKYWFSLWSCVGRDGYLKHWLETVEHEYSELDQTWTLVQKEKVNHGIEFFFKNEKGYRWYCSKCGSDMPKGIQAWIHLDQMRQDMK